LFGHPQPLINGGIAVAAVTEHQRPALEDAQHGMHAQHLLGKHAALLVYVEISLCMSVAMP